MVDDASTAPGEWSRWWFLLAIPMVRFGPRYVTLARGETWRDLAIDTDSRAAAAKLRALAQPGDTLFVWGFRPDIFIDSRLPAGTRFLESQAISGLLADRHLFSNAAVATGFCHAEPARVDRRRAHLDRRRAGRCTIPRRPSPVSRISHEWLDQYKEVGAHRFFDFVPPAVNSIELRIILTCAVFVLCACSHSSRKIADHRGERGR